MSVRSGILVGIHVICVGVLVFSAPIPASGFFSLALQLFGLLLAMWSFWSLKFRNLRIVPEPAEHGDLVMKGPYRYVRHPLYSALLLITLVWLIGAFTPLRLVMWSILFVDILLKLSYEERLLQARFSEYKVYSQRTKRLIPFIY
jgi:protein-S-isoprenylcysteine O-methyltransferase Ste14